MVCPSAPCQEPPPLCPYAAAVIVVVVVGAVDVVKTSTVASNTVLMNYLSVRVPVCCTSSETREGEGRPKTKTDRRSLPGLLGLSGMCLHAKNNLGTFKQKKCLYFRLNTCCWGFVLNSNRPLVSCLFARFWCPCSSCLTLSSSGHGHADADADADIATAAAFRGRRHPLPPAAGASWRRGGLRRVPATTGESLPPRVCVRVLIGNEKRVFTV